MITLKKVGKIIPVIGMMVGLASVANAVDVKANLRMRGDLMRVTEEKKFRDFGKEAEFLKSNDLEGYLKYKKELDETKEWSYLLNEQCNQIDNPGDGLIFSVDNGNAGAQFALWYVTAKEAGGENQWQAYFRRSFVWFKPWDCLKIRLGYVGNDTFFKERIDEWKVGNPFSLKGRNWDPIPQYINCNDVEGWGFGVEYRPLDNLIFNAGITPGKKGSVASNKPEDAAGFVTKSGDTDTFIAPWGAGVKYYWKNFEFQASYRDAGQNSAGEGTWRVLRFGAGISNEYTYTFIQPVFGFEYVKGSPASSLDDIKKLKRLSDKNDRWEFNGMCLDIYSELMFDAWKIMLHAPVTFRWTDPSQTRDVTDDVCYMESNLRVQYNLGSHGNVDDLSPYIQLGSNQDDSRWGDAYTRVWMLDKHFADSFNMFYEAGIKCKISNVEISVGAKFDQFSNYHKERYGCDWAFSVPFDVKVRNF